MRVCYEISIWFDKQCFCLLSAYLLFCHTRSNIRPFVFSAFISAVYHCDDGLSVTVRFLRGAGSSIIDDKVLSYRAVSSVTLSILSKFIRDDSLISVLKHCLYTHLRLGYEISLRWKDGFLRAILQCTAK